MLLSTSKKASFHGLKDENLNRQLERVSETRLLGKKFSDVKDIANVSYAVLRRLRKLRHFTDFHLVYVRDLFPESLV